MTKNDDSSSWLPDRILTGRESNAIYHPERNRNIGLRAPRYLNGQDQFDQEFWQLAEDIGWIIRENISSQTDTLRQLEDVAFAVNGFVTEYLEIFSNKKLASAISQDYVTEIRRRLNGENDPGYGIPEIPHWLRQLCDQASGTT